jgi:hypothetical protein
MKPDCRTRQTHPLHRRIPLHLYPPKQTAPSRPPTSRVNPINQFTFFCSPVLGTASTKPTRPAALQQFVSVPPSNGALPKKLNDQSANNFGGSPLCRHSPRSRLSRMAPPFLASASPPTSPGGTTAASRNGTKFAYGDRFTKLTDRLAKGVSVCPG